MAVSARLKSYLDGERVRYTVGKHAVVYTAQEIAAAQHVSGRQLAKSVLVKTTQGVVLAVLPAIQLIDFKKLKAALNVSKVSIGTEADIRHHFPDLEVGAMSPLGNLYHVPVIVDTSLTDAEEISFNAGSHTETITLKFSDFARLASPKVSQFGIAIQAPKKKAAAKKTSGGKKRSPGKQRSSAKKRPAKKRPAKGTKKR